MKRIINGKAFDTETAMHVCELHCTAYRNDFAYHDTALYRSPKGQFFVAGSGNAASMWATNFGSTRGPGEGMRLVDDDEARAIMERNGCKAAEFAAVGLTVEEG